MKFSLPYLCIVLWLSTIVACTHTKKTVASSTAPFHSLQSDPDLTVLLNAIGDAKIVLLGEASHGTHEYYQWRNAITKRLIEQKDFTLIAAESDWNDFQSLNNLLQQTATDSNATRTVLHSFHRWPTWLWNNEETFTLLNWLLHYNQTATTKVNLFGLDVYSFWSGLDSLTFTKDIAWQQAAKEVNQCLAAYQNDAMQYTKAVQQKKANCQKATEQFYQLTSHQTDKDDVSFYGQQQGLLALYGERYFRTLAHNRNEAWNIRERYMAETIKRLLQHFGSRTKMVVWVHNTHAGDARYVDRSMPHDTTLAEILRTEIGESKIFSVGFGSYNGTLLAAFNWNGEPHEIKMIPAKKGSWEALLHEDSASDKILISKEILYNAVYNHWIEFRSYGISNGAWSIYNRSIMPRRFDAFVYIDSTTALHAGRQ